MTNHHGLGYVIVWGLSSLVGAIWKWSNPPRTTLYMNWSDSKKPTAPSPAITPTNGLHIATRPTRGVDHKAASRLKCRAATTRALWEFREDGILDDGIALLILDRYKVWEPVFIGCLTAEPVVSRPHDQ